MSKGNFYLGNNEKNLLGKDFNSNLYDYLYEKENFNINNPYDSHAVLAKAVKKNSKVLDIGCASGNIGRILYDFKDCIVDGIELDEVAIDIAKKSGAYRKLYNFSITDEDDKTFKKIISSNEKYDYIIFGDVLEHLYNPYRAIANAAKMLKKNGSILASVPNVSHIDIIRGLIDGEFNYSDVGLLDSTHIRFFTEKSFLEMLLNIQDKYDIYFNVSLLGKVDIKPEYVNSEIIYNYFNDCVNLENYFTLQNVFKITLVDNKKSAKMYIPKDDSNIFDLISKFLEKKDNDYLALVNKYNKLEQDYLSIINSKRWKTIDKICNRLKRKK